MRTFTGVSAVRPHGPGRYEIDVDPAWTIGGKPNGGYLLATMARAAAAVADHRHPIAASAHYLRAPDPGPAEVQVDVLRSGRSAAQLRARLAQEGTVCVEALLTFGTLRPGTAPFWDAQVPAVEAVPVADCVRVPGTSPTGLQVAIMDEVDLRLDPATTGFALGRPSGSGELRGWLALPGDEPFDPIALLYAVDAFPPATFEIRPTGWVPTLELTAYVRALPAPGPVRILHRAQLVEDGRVDEVCWVWDSTGRVVAQATQLAGIRFE